MPTLSLFRLLAEGSPSGALSASRFRLALVTMFVSTDCRVIDLVAARADTSPVGADADRLTRSRSISLFLPAAFGLNLCRQASAALHKASENE